MAKKKTPGRPRHGSPGEVRKAPSLGGLIGRLEERSLRYLDLIPRETMVEKVVHLVLEGQSPWKEAGPVFDQLLEAVNQYPSEGVRTVVFGGGTGLSGVLGGDTALPGWARQPFGGLKRFFPQFTVGVCTTDDGGSSGILLQYLRCVAPGDLRRAVLSSVTPRGLLTRYPGTMPEHLESLAGALQRVLNYRFGRCPNRGQLRKPSTLLSLQVRQILPGALLTALDTLGASCVRNPSLRRVPLENQCLGNLLLLAAIYRRVSERGSGRAALRDGRPVTPAKGDILAGFQDFAEMLGAGRESVFPASCTQGELQVLYKHGVVSAGEAKSARKHSSFPVHRLWVHAAGRLRPDPVLLQRIEEARLIVIAPGSIFTSIIPIFQIPEIAQAVRNNRHALKILGVNFWVQRGETDVSFRRPGKEYHVSDLIEAYHHNIPGGVAGLFEICVVTDLKSIPGDILRNYALEGKVPIYLDKERVRTMGFHPVEAAVFSEEKLRNEKVIQHDPEKFALVVKTLCALRRGPRDAPCRVALPASQFDPRVAFPRAGYLSDYWSTVRGKIDRLSFSHPRLRQALQQVLWSNREILPEHLNFIRSVQRVPGRAWRRSTEWDNILGYYDPDEACLKIREDLLQGSEARLMEVLLIALGESLLGNYCLKKTVAEIRESEQILGKVFEIELRPDRQRRCFLGDRQLREYLRLAQLTPRPENPDRFCMLVNGTEAFTPPGLLFGLFYAWYLNNRFGGILDYEISLLRWRISELIPKPSMERTRLQKCIAFFRSQVFCQQIPPMKDEPD